MPLVLSHNIGDIEMCLAGTAILLPHAAEAGRQNTTAAKKISAALLSLHIFSPSLSGHAALVSSRLLGQEVISFGICAAHQELYWPPPLMRLSAAAISF